MRKVFLLLCFGFYFGFSVFVNAQTTNSFVGKQFRITGTDKYSISFLYDYSLLFKNDSVLAAYAPLRRIGCVRGMDLSKEREYIELKYSISSDSILINADEYMTLYESIDLEIIRREFNYSYKWIKKLCDSSLIIKNSKELGITYLMNNGRGYFEMKYLKKQPDKLVLFEDEKFSVDSYKSYEEDKKVRQILNKIKQEEKKVGKQLYSVEEYDSKEAFLKFGIVVNQSILHVKKL